MEELLTSENKLFGDSQFWDSLSQPLNLSKPSNRTLPTSGSHPVIPSVVDNQLMTSCSLQLKWMLYQQAMRRLCSLGDVRTVLAPQSISPGKVYSASIIFLSIQHFIFYSLSLN